MLPLLFTVTLVGIPDLLDGAGVGSEWVRGQLSIWFSM